MHSSIKSDADNNKEGLDKIMNCRYRATWVIWLDIILYYRLNKDRQLHLSHIEC